MQFVLEKESVLDALWNQSVTSASYSGKKLPINKWTLSSSVHHAFKAISGYAGFKMVLIIEPIERCGDCYKEQE
jgi:hypothetical protein